MAGGPGERWALLNERELGDLNLAAELLRTRSLGVRLADMLGRPIEASLGLLPEPARRTVQEITRRALERALKTAISTLHRQRLGRSRDRGHRFAAGASGAIGGFFGLGGLAVELPLTTVIMLRSIADIARSEGHDVADPRVRLDCLEVFALGGPSTADDAAESGYYAARAALAQAVSSAAQHVASHGVTREGAPVLVRLVEAIATRFGVVVEQKALLETLPIVGSVSGALINTIFIDHFQNVARGHFIVRRLERLHGEAAVRELLEKRLLGREDEPAP